MSELVVLAEHSSNSGDKPPDPGPRSELEPRPRKQVQHRLTSEQLNWLLANRALGATIQTLAAEFSVHRTTVMKHLKRSRKS